MAKYKYRCDECGIKGTIRVHDMINKNVLTDCIAIMLKIKKAHKKNSPKCESQKLRLGWNEKNGELYT